MPIIAMLLAVLSGACSGPAAELACTEMAAQEGVRIETAPELGARTATVRVCWEGSCSAKSVDLRPATTARDMGCSGPGPYAACSAEVRFTGGAQGFAEVTGLPRTPVTITVTVVGAGQRRVAHDTVEITPRMVWPNGPDCGGEKPQIAVSVGADGAVRAR